MKEKGLRRTLELEYNKTKLAVDKERLDHQRNIYNHLLTQARQEYFKTKTETADTSKDLNKVCDNLLNREQKYVTPPYDCIKYLANKFINYFNDKISNIRKYLVQSFRRNLNGHSRHPWSRISYLIKKFSRTTRAGSLRLMKSQFKYSVTHTQR